MSLYDNPTHENRTGIPNPSWELIRAERQRQIEKEGWTAEHDAQHDPEDLMNAAISYQNAQGPDEGMPPHNWPWDVEWWKPKDRLRNLVRAGALYLAASDLAKARRNFVQAKELKDMAIVCNHLIVRENLV